MRILRSFLPLAFLLMSSTAYSVEKSCDQLASLILKGTSQEHAGINLHNAVHYQINPRAIDFNESYSFRDHNPGLRVPVANFVEEMNALSKTVKLVIRKTNFQAKTIFYPFAGNDVVTPLLVFPEVKKIIFLDNHPFINVDDIDKIRAPFIPPSPFSFIYDLDDNRYLAPSILGRLRYHFPNLEIQSIDLYVKPFGLFDEYAHQLERIAKIDRRDVPDHYFSSLQSVRIILRDQERAEEKELIFIQGLYPVNDNVNISNNWIDYLNANVPNVVFAKASMGQIESAANFNREVVNGWLRNTKGLLLEGYAPMLGRFEYTGYEVPQDWNVTNHFTLNIKYFGYDNRKMGLLEF